MTYVVIGVD